MMPFEAKMEIIRIKNLLKESDTSIIYGLEEVVLLLVQNNVLNGASLNPFFVKKLHDRRELRNKLSELKRIANEVKNVHNN